MYRNPATKPMEFPIVIRIVGDYIEASQPDLDIYRVHGKISEVRRREEIGAIVLDLWKEILERAKTDPNFGVPSTPKAVLRNKTVDTLTSRKVAKLMGLSDATVRRMCDAKKLDAFRTAGGHWRIKTTDPTLGSFLPKETQ